jgi:hypothetical protein
MKGNPKAADHAQPADKLAGQLIWLGWSASDGPGEETGRQQERNEADRHHEQESPKVAPGMVDGEQQVDQSQIRSRDRRKHHD